MRRSRNLLFVLTLTTLGACAPVTPAVITPSPQASPSTVVASTMPSPVAPTSSVSPSAPVVAASPVAVPLVSPSPAGFAWNSGKLLKAYDFKGLAGVYCELATNTLYVVDAIDDNQTPRRYLVREFNNNDGTFIGAFHLAPKDQADPDHVDAMAFDRRTIPFYTYRDDEGFSKSSFFATANNPIPPNFWGLYELVTATVVMPTNLPFSPLPRAGVSALAASGDILTLGVLNLDPDKRVTGNRRIGYIRAEEDKQAQAIFSVADPFNPTTEMAMTGDGLLYMTGGQTTGAGFQVKTLDSNQKLATFATLDTIPSGIWAGPKGELYASFDSTSGPGHMRKYLADGTLAGETSLMLTDGSYLRHVAGLTFDLKGQRIVAGEGINANNKPMNGIYTFTE